MPYDNHNVANINIDKCCVVNDGVYGDDNVDTDNILDHGDDSVNDDNDDVETNEYKSHSNDGVVDNYVR